MKTLSLAALLLAAAPTAFAQDCTHKDLKPADLPPGVSVAGGTFSERGSVVTSARRSAILREACNRRAAAAAPAAGPGREETLASARALLSDMGSARGGIETGNPRAAARIEPLLARWEQQKATLNTLPRELSETLREEHGRLLAAYGAGRVPDWQNRKPPTPLDGAILNSLPESSENPRELTQRRYLDAAEAQHKLNLKRIAEAQAASQRAIAAARAPGDGAAPAAPPPPASGGGPDSSTCDAVREARGIGSDSAARQRCAAMGAYK